MAASAWNLAVNDNLLSIDYTLMCFTPKELKNSIYERADHFEFDLAKMLRWERNLWKKAKFHMYYRGHLIYYIWDIVFLLSSI